MSDTSAQPLLEATLDPATSESTDNTADKSDETKTGDATSQSERDATPTKSKPKRDRRKGRNAKTNK